MNLRIIQKLYSTYKTPKHVREHMRIVSTIAVFLAQKMKANVKFVRHLALLHDFLKMLVFKDHRKSDPKIWKQLRKKYPNMHDTEVASLLLKKIKEPKLAKSIRTQQFDAVISNDHPLETLEEKIVYYADKRVAHTKIVTLKERFKEGGGRYPTKPGEEKTIRLIRQKIYALEKQLCKKAGVGQVLRKVIGFR